MTTETNEKSEPRTPDDLQGRAPMAQYGAIIHLVTANEGRLDHLKVTFLVVDSILMLTFGWVVSFWDFRGGDPWTLIDFRVFPFFIPVIGMFASAVWIALTMRIQMMLRLCYFHLRQVERQIGLSPCGIFSAADRYWEGEPVKSLDSAETLHYLKGADGRIGRIPSRLLSWMMPLLFFTVFLYLLIGLISGMPYIG